MNYAKSTKAELEITGEWYSQNAAKDEKMVVTASSVVTYYADQSEKNSIDLGSFEANCYNTFIEEAQQISIDYVVWSSHHGNLNPDSFYKRYKVI